MLERSKDCHNEGIMRSLQEVIKRTFKGIIGIITEGGLLIIQIKCSKIYLFIHLFISKISGQEIICVTFYQ